jgi:hypothetical protein
VVTAPDVSSPGATKTDAGNGHAAGEEHHEATIAHDEEHTEAIDYDEHEEIEEHTSAAEDQVAEQEHMGAEVEVNHDHEESASVDPAAGLRHADDVDAAHEEVAEEHAAEEIEVDTLVEDPKPRLHDDLLDMVSMLEGTKLSEAVIAGEIPDEE